MKVLHLISTSVFSGAENVACQIINMFKQDETIDMCYVAVLGENESILKDRNIKYIGLKKFSLKYIKKVIDEYKPDIIHAHDIKSSFFASFFYKKSIIISHVHNNHEDMRVFGLKTFLYNLVSKKFKKIIWVSKSALNSYYYKNKIMNKSVVLYNVINENEIIKKAKEDNKEYNYDLIFLGRLTYQKNPERLIEIAHKVVESEPLFKMAIVGDGELKNELEKMIHNYGLEKNVFLLGFLNNPYNILKNSKMLILTSRFEGTPMVALESIALGVPIISTHTDGMIDIIENNKNGYLCKNDDEFAKVIKNIMLNKEKLEKLKKSTIESSKMINSIEHYKEEINKIYFK